MSLLNSLQPLIQVCQFLGLAPFSMNQTTLKWESNHSLKFISMIIITVNATILLVGIIFNHIFIDHKFSTIYVTLVAVLFSLNQTHAMIALLELFMKSDRHIQLFNKFERLDFLFKQHFKMHVNYTTLKRSCHRIMMVWICEFSSLLIMDIITNANSKSNYDLYYALAFHPSYILSKLSYAYFLILVSLVHENLEVLNKYLKSLIKPYGYYVNETFSNQNKLKHEKKKFFHLSQMNLSPETVLFMKEVYWNIWEASTTISNLMRWSLAIGLSYETFYLIYNAYNFVEGMFIVENHSSIIYIFLVLIITIALGNVLFIAVNCSKIGESVSTQK